jgi:hypothetical protein
MPEGDNLVYHMAEGDNLVYHMAEGDNLVCHFLGVAICSTMKFLGVEICSTTLSAMYYLFYYTERSFLLVSFFMILMP